MIRYHDVSQLSTAELGRAKRELQANLNLIAPHSPAHVPIVTALAYLSIQRLNYLWTIRHSDSSARIARPT
jgi:hypothetical protein